MIAPFLAGVKYRDYIYYSMMNGNGLLKYDPKTDETTFIAPFSKEKNRDRLHVQAILYLNEMWLIPLEGDYIICVNLDTFEMVYFKVFNRERFSNTHAFYAVVRDKDYVFLLPNRIDTIERINLETKECEPLFSAGFLAGFFSIGGFVTDDVLNIIRSDGRIGLKLKTDSGEVIFQDTEESEMYYHYYICIENECWMIPRSSGSIMLGLIDKDGHLNSDRVVVSANGSYYRGMKIDSKMVFFPFGGNKSIMIFDTKTNSVSYLDNIIDRNRSCGLYFEINTIDSDEGHWAATTNGTILDLSDLNSIKTYSSTIDNGVIDTMYTEYEKCGMIDDMFSDGIIYEGKAIIQLERFIEFVDSKEF